MTTTVWMCDITQPAFKAISSNKDIFELNKIYSVNNFGIDNKILNKYPNYSDLIENIEIKLAGKRFLDGQILLVKSTFLLGQLVDNISNKIWSSNDLTKFWPNKFSIDRVRNYLRLYIEKEIKELVSLATYLLWLKEHEMDNKVKNIILIPSDLWGKEIGDYFNKIGLNSYIYDDIPNKLFSRIMQIMIISIRILVSMVRNFFTRIFHLIIPKTNYLYSENDYKISVPYRRSVNLKVRNDLFWYGSSNIDPDSIIISIESTAYPFDKSELKLLNDEGIKAIALGKKGADLTGELPVWKSTFQIVIMDMKRLFFSIKIGFFALLNYGYYWQSLKLVELMQKVDLLQNYYESLQIKVDIGLDSVEMSAIRAIAMDNIGGIRIGPQWSTIEILSSFLNKNDNIYFCWGKTEEYYFKKAGSSVETLIISGYIYDKFIDSNRIKAQKIRDQITSSGAKFILTLLDSRIDDDSYVTTEEMKIFYEVFLNECIKDETLGLIIKPKDSKLFKKLTNINFIINDLIKTGRCLFLEDENEIRKKSWHINNYFTFITAMASDINFSETLMLILEHQAQNPL